MAIPETIKALIYLLQAAQIAALQWNKVLTKISTKYANFADLFLSNLAIE